MNFYQYVSELFLKGISTRRSVQPVVLVNEEGETYEAGGGAGGGAGDASAAKQDQQTAELLAIKNKIISAPATEAKQDSSILILQALQTLITTQKDLLEAINARTEAGLELRGDVRDFHPEIVPVDENTKTRAKFDGDRNLAIRGTVLTDERSFRVNFANNSLAVGIGNCTFTQNSDVVIGENLQDYDLHVGDYVRFGADAEAHLAQVAELFTNKIILETAYTGAGGTGAAVRQLLQTITGAGASVSVATGQMTIAAGTTANAYTFAGRLVDYAPLVFRERGSFSQRIANQTILLGMNDVGIAPKWFARFRIDGTTNTIIICEAGRNPTQAPSTAETTSVTVTIPRGLTTASFLDYRIEHMTEAIHFFINDIRVATITTTMPQPYDIMACGITVLNGAIAPGSNTNIVCDFIAGKNHNKIEVGIMSNAETIIAAQPDMESFSFSQAGVIAINTDLLVIDCAKIRGLFIQCTAMGTSGVITPQWTNDPSLAAGTRQAGSWFDMNNTTSQSINSATIRYSNIYARFLILRLTAATTGGTTTLIVHGSQAALQTYFARQAVSGTVTANVGTGGHTAYSDSTTNLGANATFTGTSRDLGANLSYAKFVVNSFSDQAGSFFIEKSINNTNWFRASEQIACAANTGKEYVHNATTRYVRVVYTNGANAQGSFNLSSSIIRI